MLTNAVLVALIAAVLLWAAWDFVKPKIDSWRKRVPSPVDADPQSERLRAIQSAEEFRAYAKASGHTQAHSLIGQAIASLYSPEKVDEG